MRRWLAVSFDMPAEDLPRASRDACKNCRRHPCVCSRDRAANEWAEAHGVSLPSEYGTGRLKGGHLGDRDVRRGGLQEQLRKLEASRLAAYNLRGLRELKAIRIEKIGELMIRHAQEREKLDSDVRLLDALLDGEGKTQAEIAESLGYKSHSSVNEMITELKLEACTRRQEAAAVLAPKCRRPRCGDAARVHVGAGRDAFYCGDRCRKAHFEATKRAKLRTITITSTNPSESSTIPSTN